MGNIAHVKKNQINRQVSVHSDENNTSPIGLKAFRVMLDS